MDALPVIKTFKSLQPVMANERVKSRLRLLCVFGFNGSDVIFATDGPEDKVYGFGRNQNGCLGLGIADQNLTVPKLNPHLTGKRLATIGCGFCHCIGLTADGKCLSWGDNRYGSLGVGTLEDSSTPQLVHGLEDLRVVAVACGNSHNIVLTDTSRVYAFGRNLFGQLGDESLVSRPYAVLLAAIADQTVTSISAGRNHSLALTAGGRLYLWGLNICGQLGRHKDQDIAVGQLLPQSDTPTQLTLNTGAVVVKALCGPDNTLLLTTDGQLYAFGDNKYGQIGIGSRKDIQWTPVRIDNGVRFKDIATSGQQSLAIAVSVDDLYYVWGSSHISSPRPTLELMATHSVYDIFAKYSRIDMTFKTIVFSNENRINGNENIHEYRNVDQKQLYFENKLIGGINDMNIGLDDNVSVSNDSNCDTSSGTVGLDPKPMNSEELTPLKVFAKHLSDMFDNECDYDLVFVFNDKRIYCHKSVIKIRNKQFWQKCQQMLNKINNNSIDYEIHVKSYSYDSFYPFLQFLYAIKPKITPRIAREVSKLATLYGESVLQEWCAQALGSSDETIDLSNVCSLYEMSITDGSVELEKRCVEFVTNNLIPICKSDSFHALPQHVSKRLMQSVFE